MEKKKKGIYPAPKFKSLEEEDKFWETHSPLAEGYEMEYHPARPTQERRSFLAVRLSGKEITQLRDVAAKRGVGPSTYARSLILQAIEEEKEGARQPTAEEIAAALKKAGITVVEKTESASKGKRKAAVVR